MFEETRPLPGGFVFGPVAESTVQLLLLEVQLEVVLAEGEELK